MMGHPKHQPKPPNIDSQGPIGSPYEFYGVDGVIEYCWTLQFSKILYIHHTMSIII